MDVKSSVASFPLRSTRRIITEDNAARVCCKVSNVLLWLETLNRTQMLWFHEINMKLNPKPTVCFEGKTYWSRYEFHHSKFFLPYHKLQAHWEYISSVSSMLNFEWHPYQVGHVKATFHIQLLCWGFCNARFKAWGLGFENVDLFQICAQSFELVNLLTQRWRI
jgi:hypothetical protein